MKIKYMAFAAALLLNVSVFAQHNEEVTIEGSYRPKVNKVDKILLKPDIPKQVFTIPEAEVKVLDIEHRFNLNMDKISPVNYNVKKDSREDVSNNFLMAGFGSRISPVFLYRHNSTLGRNLGFGLGLKHFSSWLDIKDYAPSGFMNNAIEMSLVRNKPNKAQVVGNVYYKNDNYHYYGIRLPEWTGDSISLAHGAPRQVYNTVGAHYGVSSTTTRQGESLHDLDIDYHYLFGKVGDSKEHHAKLDYDLGYAKSWWGKKEYPQKIGVAMGAQYVFNEFMEQKGDNRLLVNVRPYFEMKNEYFRLNLGAILDGATSFKSTKGLFAAYPDVQGSLYVLQNCLEFYAGVDGGRKLFTFSDLIEENPFVSTRVQMAVTNVKLGFEGGFRANIVNKVDFHVGVRYRQTENDYFYRQRYTAAFDGMGMDRPVNSFDVIYDDTRTVNVLGNIRWKIIDGLTMDANFDYNQCDPSKEEHAWYRPKTEGSLGVNYQIIDELSVNAAFLYRGGLWAQQASKTSPTYKTVKMDDVYDLGFGVDYEPVDKLTIFLKADNLLHKKYQLYLDYPVSGIEFFAGLKLAF